MKLSSNLIGNSNDETNFPHKLLLTDTKVSRLCKVFANGSSVNLKFSETLLSKMIQPGEVPADLLEAILQAVLLIGVEALK